MLVASNPALSHSCRGITNEGKTCIVVPDNCILEVCGLKFALERIPDDTSREKNTTGDDEDEDADVGE